MGNKISANGGKLEHHPLVGPRPMKYAYTIAASVAQFPFVYHWRYTIIFRFFIYAFIPTTYLCYKMEKIVNGPENVEKWRKIREEWYTRKPHPENDYF